NLYQKAASLYDGLATKEFYEALEKVSSGKEFKSMPDEFKKFYDDTVQPRGTNSKCLEALVGEIDRQIGEIRKLPATEQATKQNILQSLAVFRAQIQVKSFELTPLFIEAFEYVKQNTKCVDIQQYLDTRVLGGSQMSHSFIMTGKPLEDWFKAKFNGQEGEFGDDIAGSEIKRLTLLEALKDFRKVKFSHILITLACYEECLDKGRLKVENIWDEKKFGAARRELIKEANVILDKIQGAKNKLVAHPESKGISAGPSSSSPKSEIDSGSLPSVEATKQLLTSNLGLTLMPSQSPLPPKSPVEKSPSSSSTPTTIDSTQNYAELINTLKWCVITARNDYNLWYLTSKNRDRFHHGNKGQLRAADLVVILDKIILSNNDDTEKFQEAIAALNTKALHKGFFNKRAANIYPNSYLTYFLHVLNGLDLEGNVRGDCIGFEKKLETLRQALGVDNESIGNNAELIAAR
ncbi:MAG: hypothetical protein ACHQ1D_12615, partial [Nitrososphaerales archaeon]